MRSLILSLVLLAAPASAQVTCTVIGNLVTCAQPSSPPTTQSPLNQNTGVVIHPDGTVTPYTILSPPAPSQRPAITPLPPLTSQPVIVMPSVPMGY